MEVVIMPSKLEICSCTVIHQDVVDAASHQMLNNEVSAKLSELFKMFADPTRIKLLNVLYISEMCVCDLAACLNMTQSAISHQLRLLKLYNLVKARKDGKVVYYSLADSHVTDILDKGLEHINE
jgi:DNA-binding transcriptional ArsR family regulator